MTATLVYGFTITVEFCGRPHAMHVVRQYGNWVACYDSRRDALAAIDTMGGHLVGT